MASPSPLPMQMEVTSATADGITALAFQPTAHSPYLLCSSWDCTLRLFDVSTNEMIASSELSQPALDCVWTVTGTCSAVSSLSGEICVIDWQVGSSSILGAHAGAARSLSIHEQTGALISTSWDGSVHLYDTRSSEPLLAKDEITGSKFWSHSSPDWGFGLVIAGTNRKIWHYDLRKMQRQTMESPLMEQTRCIRMLPRCYMPNAPAAMSSESLGLGYVLSSVEGRAAVNYFHQAHDVKTADKQSISSYAFKCHRQPIKGSDKQIAHPVNAIAFHPKHGSFVTGGGDGCVSVWDGLARKRVCRYSAQESSISSLAFSADGDKLAIASSYVYQNGESGKGKTKDRIFVRNVSDAEMQPRRRIG